jgi:hypothetical protein
VIDPGAKTPNGEQCAGDDHAKAIRELLDRIHGRDDTAGMVSVLTGIGRDELAGLGGFADEVQAQIAEGRVTLRFWVCPIREHGGGELRETVRWIDRVAHCTWPGCGRTSVDASATHNS